MGQPVMGRMVAAAAAEHDRRNMGKSTSQPHFPQADVSQTSTSLLWVATAPRELGRTPLMAHRHVRKLADNSRAPATSPLPAKARAQPPRDWLVPAPPASHASALDTPRSAPSV